MSYAKSEKLLAQASKSLIGGVNSPVRSFRRVGGHPLFATKGEGPYLWDADGNKYIDLVMSYGPHLFGHAHPRLVKRINKALEGSFCFGMSSEAEIEWAEAFLKFVPAADRVRVMSTGTEATSTAVRLARGTTGRKLILKFAGHYHGHGDSLLMDSGSGVATLSAEATADSKGIPDEITKLARVVEFNDSKALEAVFQKDGKELAAVIVEPIMGNMGVIPPEKGFLEKIRALCTQHGALMIIDEVMTGFRVHKHSAQGLYNVKPDISCFGKIVGGGLPLAAVAGRADVMKNLAPEGGVYQAGTLSGNPLSIHAGLEMMKLINEEDPYARLEDLGAHVQKVLEECAAKKKLSVQVQRVGSMFTLFFRKDPVKNARDARDTDNDLFQKYFWSLLKEGFMAPPSPFEALFLGVAHLDIKKEEWSRRLEKVFDGL